MNQKKAIDLVKECAEAYAETNSYEIIKYEVVNVGSSVSISIWYAVKGSRFLHKAAHLFVGPCGRIEYPSGFRNGHQTYRKFTTMDDAIRNLEKYHAKSVEQLIKKPSFSSQELQ